MTNRQTRLLLASTALALSTQLVAQSANPKATVVVETGAGKVQGLMDGGISTYKGIRYGKAPVGATDVVRLYLVFVKTIH